MPIIIDPPIKPPRDTIKPPRNVIIRNNNPHGTVCNRCRAIIGHVYPRNRAPHLPKHDFCYCYYEYISTPPTTGPPRDTLPIDTPIKISPVQPPRRAYEK